MIWMELMKYTQWWTVFSQLLLIWTVCTTKQYNVTESVLWQSFYHYLHHGPLMYLAEPGEARGCSTNTSYIGSLIHSLIQSWFVSAPPRPNGWRWCFQSCNRLCYNFWGDSKFWRASKLHYWFKSYGNFAEWVEFDYGQSFSGEGSASAACAAGLFFMHYILGSTL